MTFRLLIVLAALAGWLLPSPPANAADPIDPQKAFAMSARAAGPATVEVVFRIAKDYYLYGGKLRFEAEPATVALGSPERPPGEIRQDEFFGEVETYRGELRILLPVTPPADATAFRLAVTSQGCWDGGVCYPPLTQTADINLAASAPPPAASLLDRALGRDPASATESAALTSNGAPAAAEAASGNESERIAGLFGNSGPFWVLASFFGFGLLLAFTPCTFPMIPILSGIIVGHGHRISRGRAFALSFAYVLGMAVTYAAAGVAAGFTGTLFAAALQNVWVLSAFALVFVALALAMFGFYELQLPTALQSRLAGAASHEKGGHLAGVAAMGALSALIIGPCVAAPLAGALLYIARTGDAILGGLALFAMGLGMGAPLIAVGVAARTVLPKAGPWMEGVKKAFGVFLLAAAVWFLTPVLPPLAVMLTWAALLLFSGIFLHAIDPLPPHAKNWQRFLKGVGVALLVGGVAMLVGALAGSRDPLQPLAVLRAPAANAAGAQDAEPRFISVSSVAELDARLAAADRPAMLDFYADWCVSCKEMERDTFSDPQVSRRMEQMLLLKADVTAGTDEHRTLLRRFSLFGPPGIIFFSPGGKERADQRVIGFMAAEPFSSALDRVLRQ